MTVPLKTRAELEAFFEAKRLAQEPKSVKVRASVPAARVRRAETMRQKRAAEQSNQKAKTQRG